MNKINIVTRRDFLKQTTVLATGASTITFGSSLLSCNHGNSELNDTDVIRWSFVPDFPDIGDNHASMFSLFQYSYDDSQALVVKGFDQWNKAGAAWLRASLPAMCREELISILPDVSQVTKAYVNKELVYKRRHPGFRHVPFPNPSEPEPIEIAQETNRHLLAEKIAEKLEKGGLVALKAERWPDALPYYDIQDFSWHAEHGKQGAFLVIDSVPDDVVLVKCLTADGIAIWEFNPRIQQLPHRIPMSSQHLGRMHLVIKKADGKIEYPFHILGIGFFHWGYHDANGFRDHQIIEKRRWGPYQSNLYVLDELFAFAKKSMPESHWLSFPACLFESPEEQPFSEKYGFATVKKCDYMAKFKELFVSNRLSLVGLSYVSMNPDGWDGETVLRSYRLAREIYRKKLGVEPILCSGHDGTISPQFPQVMRLAGYQAFVACNNTWGQETPASHQDMEWRTPDGTAVRFIPSFYHKYSTGITARRAVRLGRAVAVTTEEFACNDVTKSIEESDWMDYRQKDKKGPLPWLASFSEFGESLHQEGTILVPVTIEKYLALTEQDAKANPMDRDDQVSYKGWTGGTPQQLLHQALGHQCYEILNGCFNVQALLEVQGVKAPDKNNLLKLWKSVSLDSYVSHQWSTPSKELIDNLTKYRKQAANFLEQTASALSSLIKPKHTSIVVSNVLGWSRSDLVAVNVTDEGYMVDSDGHPLPQQHAGQNEILFWAQDVPSFGACAFRWIKGPCPENQQGADVRRNPDGTCLLSNPSITIKVHSDGTFTNEKDYQKERFNQIWAMLPENLADESSSPEKPLNFDCFEHLVPGKIEIIETGPALTKVRVTTTWATRSDVVVNVHISLASGTNQVEVSVEMDFHTPHIITDLRLRSGTEGQYFPGVIATFPCRGQRRDLVLDQMYCVARNVMDAGGREVWTHLPFRNWTGRGLGMAASEHESYALITKGLVHFFQVPRENDSVLGLSLGNGPDQTDEGYFEDKQFYHYAVRFDNQPNRLERAWIAAREFYVPLSAHMDKGAGSGPEQLSLVSSSTVEAPVIGIDRTEKGLAVRVVNLTLKDKKTRLSMTQPDKSKTIHLPPRAVREEKILL